MVSAKKYKRKTDRVSPGWVPFAGKQNPAAWAEPLHDSGRQHMVS